MKNTSRRIPETLADYLVVAICPTLIALLVGSLMFFLVEVFYPGDYKWRMLWVMAMFVMGIVCLARLSMIEGMAYASLYVLPLGGVVTLGLMYLAPGTALISLPLMALVWWAAHKLVWDCTLIDDTQDASGQGLLGQMGLDPEAANSGGTAPTAPAESLEPEATSGTPPSALAWWQSLIEPDRRPHAHGIWVVYFSLAALPLFGFGGWFVPADSEIRGHVFWLLITYVACGLGLLLATSFLGLRRYLRQRRLEMPLEMTATWITVGSVLIGLTLVVAAILPRTRREQSLRQLPVVVTSVARRASRFAMGKEGTKDSTQKDAATTDAKENQATDRRGESGRPGSKSSDQESKSGDKSASAQGGEKNQSQKSDGQAGSQESGEKGNDSKGSKSASGKAGQGKSASNSSGRSSSKQSREFKNENSEHQQQNQQQSSPEAEKRDESSPQNNSPDDARRNDPPPSQSSSRTVTKLASQLGQALMTVLKWLFYVGLLVAALVLAWLYRDELLAAWRKLLDELRDLWAGWFGKKTAEEMTAAAEAPIPPRPFAAFSDPFASGASARMSWPELVRYSFQAVEAWGRERECPRQDGQTAHEFAQALAALEPEITDPLQSLAACYSQLAYAPRRANQGPTEVLRQLWVALRSSGPPPIATSQAAGRFTT